MLTNRLKLGEAVDIYFVDFNSYSQDFLWFYSTEVLPLPPVFTALCLFKCLLKELGSKQAKSHWLHLFDFSPLCIFKCVLKALA